MRILLAASLAGIVLLAAAACDQATPVAPSGTTLTISANPGRIEAQGSSNITVVALKPDGTPVNPGTVVRFSTTLGTIDETAETDDSGVARAVLRGDGRVGTATVTATSGIAESASVDVKIGSLGGSIALQASPSTVSSEGGQPELLALVRDDEGQLLEGAAVNFQTEVGTLQSRGSVRFTDARGEVRDRLTVTEQDLAAINAPSFVVRAQTSTATGGLIEDTFTIRIQSSAPIASFNPVNAGGNKVFFNNTSTGAEPLAFEWDFQNDGVTDSNDRSPTFDYGSPGTFTVRLVASNSAGTDTEIQTITVPVP